MSWNVNGIRACIKKGFLDWLSENKPDIVCLQETKADGEVLDKIFPQIPGYTAHYNSAEKKGYSGVATLCRKNPASVQRGFGIRKFDFEGRVLITDHKKFLLLNVYFPNGQKNDERLQYKLDFYAATLKFCNKLVKAGKNLVICGDYNTAHKEIDIARPKENEKISGFLPIERAWLDTWVKAGFVDSFRLKYPDKKDEYSWWSYRSAARARNVGWRIDYHFVSQKLKSRVMDAGMDQKIMGSDHCPLWVEIK